MSSKSRNPFWKSIGFRIWVWYTCIFLAVALLFLFVSTNLLSKYLAQRDQESIQLKWNELASRYEFGGLDALKNEPDLENFLVRVVGPGQEVQLYRNRNLYEDFQIEILDSTHPDSKGWIFIPERIEEDEFSFLEGKERLEIVSGKVGGKNLLQVGISSERREDFIESFHILFFVSLLPLYLVGGTLLTFRTLRPLRSIISSVKSIQAGHMETRVPTHASGDELDQLALLFNDMLNRIQRLVEGMRNSLDNVAHDLRTPVTRLRAVAETALQMEPDHQRYQEALADCLEESDKILTLLNTLMDISEAETGSMRLNLEPVVVPALIQDTVALYANIAEDKNIQIQANCEKEILLRADKNRLRQVLANLLDNAIKYTEPGGRVELEARCENGEALLFVKDTGTGIEEDELPKIWDRLYRSDKTRASKGIGLGLSLVRAIVRAHGGRVEATSSPGQGSVFTLHFPLVV